MDSSCRYTSVPSVVRWCILWSANGSRVFSLTSMYWKLHDCVWYDDGKVC